MEYVRIQDHVVRKDAHVNPSRLGLSAFPGEWHNTNFEAPRIRRIVLSLHDGELAVRVFASGDRGDEDWGTVRAEAVYADGLSSSDGMSFTAWCRRELMETRIDGNINQGLLVVAMFGTWRDRLEHPSLFSREFFHRS